MRCVFSVLKAEVHFGGNTKCSARLLIAEEQFVFLLNTAVLGNAAPFNMSETARSMFLTQQRARFSRFLLHTHAIKYDNGPEILKHP